MKSLIKSAGSLTKWLAIGFLAVIITISLSCSKDKPTESNYPITETITDIDGNVYKTVKIGDQLWMAENLKVTHYRNGDAIPNVTVNAPWQGLTTGAYCEYNNDGNNVATYGRLYNWFAVTDIRKIVPAGWHAPTNAEWQTLINYLGGDSIAGGKMKEVGTAYWQSPNTGATDESGFSGMPGGYRIYSGSYSSMGYNAHFWSSMENYSGRAFYRILYYSNSKVYHNYNYKQDGYSVRCVKD
jgi:uncharacterized protein (TIGR02145 family)